MKLQMDIDRRSYDERRQVDYAQLPSKLERRKRPDRRRGGFEVKDIIVSEAEFSDVFAKFLARSR